MIVIEGDRPKTPVDPVALTKIRDLSTTGASHNGEIDIDWNEMEVRYYKYR
jgi:hypothetical protein